MNLHARLGAPRQPDFVTVCEFETACEAEIAKGALEAFGIECYLAPRAPLITHIGSGYLPWQDLVVRRKDEARARDVLADNEDGNRAR